jgi:hypothetical protein
MTERVEDIGKAHCLASFRCKGNTRSYLAGVVRVGDINKVLVIQIEGEHFIRIVPPHNCPGEVLRNPAYSCWELATLDEAKKLFYGKIPTYRRPALGRGIKSLVEEMSGLTR